MAAFEDIHVSVLLLAMVLGTLGVSGDECAVADARSGACKYERGCIETRGVYFTLNQFNSFKDIYSTTEKGVATSPKESADCCRLCAEDPDCAYWSYYRTADKRTGYAQAVYWTCELAGADECFSAPQTQVPGFLNLTSGGKCNVNPGVSGDPHFVGAHGTRFDFNGIPDQSFCLITENALHINMYLSGYYDTKSSIGATIGIDGKVIRTWIRGLGIMWMNNGVKHTLHLAARPGKLAGLKRGPGFMGLIEVDGSPINVLAQGESYDERTVGLRIEMLGSEMEGQREVDLYKVVIDGHISFKLRLRAAHPLLWLADDAEVHIDMTILQISLSDNAHGILGQTYRLDHHERAVRFQTILANFHSALQADGENGIGFLDGRAADYKTSGILAADCKFASFQELLLPPLSAGYLKKM